MRAKLSESRRAHEDKVIIRSVLDEVIDKVVAAGDKPKKVDGRKRNKGTETRLPHSPAFKLRAVKDFHRYNGQFQSTKAEIISHVADLYSVSTTQMYEWLRKEKVIEEAAKNRVAGRTYRRKKKKGKFHEAEEQLFAKFKEERKVGRRVGPRWLRGTIKQLVDDMRPPYPLAELFKARRGWLRRFCTSKVLQVEGFASATSSSFVASPTTKRSPSKSASHFYKDSSQCFACIFVRLEITEAILLGGASTSIVGASTKYRREALIPSKHTSKRERSECA